MVSAGARIEAVRNSALRRVERAPRPVLRLALAFFHGIRDVEPFDRAMTLAAQVFTSLFPVLITLAPLFRDKHGLVGDVATSLPEGMRTTLEVARPSGTGQAATLGVFGSLVVPVSATSLSRALGRMYAKAWHRPASGWNGGWRWIVVIVAISATTIVTQVLTHVASGLAQYLGALSISFLLNTSLWWGVPWLLLDGGVALARLLPAAILTGIGSVGLTIAGRIYLPRALKVGEELFGDLGVAFTLIGWLFVMCFVLVVATVLGAVLVQPDAQAAADPDAERAR